MIRIRSVKKYIHVARGIVESIIGKDKIKSIVLFGSFARNEARKNSDVDLLFIVSRNTPEELISKARKKLYLLSVKTNPQFGEGFFSKMLWSLNMNTGIKISGFVCGEDDIMKWNFPRIFGSNKLMSKLLAPRKAVLYTIRHSYKLLFGEDIIAKIPQEKGNLEVDKLEIVKSFVMNTLLALGGLLLTMLYEPAHIYCWEAMKWTLLAYSYAMRKKPNLRTIIRELRSEGMDVFYPSDGIESEFYCINVLKKILKIHMALLKE